MHVAQNPITPRSRKSLIISPAKHCTKVDSNAALTLRSCQHVSQLKSTLIQLKTSHRNSHLTTSGAGLPGHQ
ncbi:hypothetical protein CY34DRAFT_811543 [Suillus luteus UH-Slu-Lm8-n1]|uniref:Uncharacterized protein n=1 Tax=Suillus luteus UH-Slu-Lm8-n1 TaxID=930992 RepID=A0A0D0A341_9AGAM|nr:hypothetical protein CY34DRAFT_811543 [Suillus luteus UH-Slu-Lm8-n1]